MEAGGCLLTFEYILHTNVGEYPGTVKVKVEDNGIEGFPASALPFKSANDHNMGIEVENGYLSELKTFQLFWYSPGYIRMPHGLIDFGIQVDHPGDTALVTIYLPEPAPAGYSWYKKHSITSWTDFSEYAAFNDDRTAVTLTLVDGGIGDDDGIADGIIHDPSGLVETISDVSDGASGEIIPDAIDSNENGDAQDSSDPETVQNDSPQDSEIPNTIDITDEDAGTPDSSGDTERENSSDGGCFVSALF